MGNRLPYEYYRDEQGNVLLNEEIDIVLDTVIGYVKDQSLSLREAAGFIQDTTGKPLTYEGLRSIIKRRDRDEASLGD